MANKNKDIELLKKRLSILLKNEQYEAAAVIKRWIDELSSKPKLS